MKKILILLIITIGLTNCSPSYRKVIIKKGKQATLYVDGMNGAENLVFDGKGSLFVTGLDGYIYRIKPTDNPYKGKIDIKKKIGKMCLGIEIANENHLYIAVKDNNNNAHLIICDKNFEDIKVLTPEISGMNGIIKEGKYLYLASSNINPLWRSGSVLRIDTTNLENFKKPTVYIDNLGIVNGLKFSHGKEILYFTQLFGSLHSYNLKDKKLSTVYKSPGFLQLFDDIVMGKDNSIILCHNGQEGMSKIKDGKISKNIYHFGSLKAPSAARYGKGDGFLKDHLYITEYGLKAPSLTMNGRGVWIVDPSVFYNQKDK